MLIYVLFVFQVAGFGLLAYLMLQMYLALRQDASAGSNQSNQIQQSVSPVLQRNLAEMMAELRRTSDQINRDLAIRSAALQRQLDDAEKKIAVLEEALRHATPSPAPVTSTVPAREIPGAASGLSLPVSESIPPPAPSVPEVDPAAPVDSSTEFRPIDLREAGKYQQILRLADEGLSSLEIARRTQMGREEVELVLGLRNEGKSA